MGKRITRELDSYTQEEIDQYKALHGGRMPRKPRNRDPQNKYQYYIYSDRWTKRKNDYYQIHTKQCSRCSSFNNIALHHMFYEKKSFGKEPDEYLTPLCQWCHASFHREYGIKQDMIAETKYFINKYKNPLTPNLYLFKANKHKDTPQEEKMIEVFL